MQTEAQTKLKRLVGQSQQQVQKYEGTIVDGHRFTNSDVLHIPRAMRMMSITGEILHLNMGNKTTMYWVGCGGGGALVGVAAWAMEHHPNLSIVAFEQEEGSRAMTWRRIRRAEMQMKCTLPITLLHHVFETHDAHKLINSHGLPSHIFCPGSSASATHKIRELLNICGKLVVCGARGSHFSDFHPMSFQLPRGSSLSQQRMRMIGGSSITMVTSELNASHELEATDMEIATLDLQFDLDFDQECGEILGGLDDWDECGENGCGLCGYISNGCSKELDIMEFEENLFATDQDIISVDAA